MAMVRSSRLLLFISSINLIHLVRITIAQPKYIYYSCSNTGNFTSNSTYQANLNSLLSSISSNTEINYGFYNFSVGQNSDKVNAIALCRGDVSQDECRNCVNDSIHELTQLCPFQKEAIVWYDYCMLRYSNLSILGTVEKGLAFYTRNEKTPSNLDQFNKALGNLLANLQSRAASGGSLRKFGTGEVKATSLEKIYALVQCTPDLSEVQCRKCLDWAIGYIPQYCDRTIGGKVVTLSCNLRFEVYPFYESTASAPPSTPVNYPPASL